MIQASALVLTLAGLMIMPAYADATNVPSLVISQLKITSSNGQFITLFNTTDSVLDMSKYQLVYFNSYDLSKATTNKLISLSGMVPPHGYFIVSDGTLLLCYQLTVASVSLSLSSTSGLIELIANSQSSPGGSVTQQLQDLIGWSKSAAIGAQTLPASPGAFLERQPTDDQNNPIVLTPGAGSWQQVQPKSTNSCDLAQASSLGGSGMMGSNMLLPPSQPPSIFAADTPGVDSAGLAPFPEADNGLMSPVITELLPNPMGTGNDARDEYIELYNPNSVAFDLTGFKLQVGTSSLHSYTFLSGSSLPPRAFTAFYASTTGLSLSNSGGQARLIDPLGSIISETDVYSSASDGQAWALADGKWYWTTGLTPGATNVIKLPAVKSSITSKASTAKPLAKATTKSTKAKAAVTRSATKSTSKSSSPSADTAKLTPIHPWTLAVVMFLALLYAAYEYRSDISNFIHRLRKHFRAGRASRI